MTTAIDGQDLNNIRTAGVYSGTNLANAPANSFWIVTVEEYANTGHVIQTAKTIFGTVNAWVRSFNADPGQGWTAWAEADADRISRLGGDIVVPQGNGSTAFASVAHINQATQQHTLEVRSHPSDPAGNDPYMAFHRPGIYATLFGLDAQNEFAFGGWSEGTASYKFLTEKNGSKLVNARQKVFNIRDYGAVHGGDATAAINAAIADINASEAGGVLLIPTGVYYVTGQVGGTMYRPITVRGQGYNSKLVFTGNGFTNGFVLWGGYDDFVPELEDIAFEATNSTSCQQGSLVILRGGGYAAHPGIRVNNVTMRGDLSATPGTWLNLINPKMALISNVFIEGNLEQPYGTASQGIYLVGDKWANTDAVLLNCKVMHVHTAFAWDSGNINGTPTFEGIQFRDCFAVCVQTGVRGRGGYYQAPGYGWSGGHINAQYYCFDLDNLAQFRISDAQLYLDCNNNPQCHILAKRMNGLSVSDCTLYYINQLGGAIVGQAAGIVAQQGTTGLRVRDVDFYLNAGSAGIRLDDNIGRVKYGGNAMLTGGGPILSGGAASVIDMGGNG